jgi:D-sedoheptulose 7-phosphate isomerase
MVSSRIEYPNYLFSLFDITRHDIEVVTSRLLECIRNNNSVWLIGNGGSASTAEHFETDLSFARSNDLQVKIKVSSLTSNSALISAIANDLGYENIFSHQLKRKAVKGDLCLMISASGNSKNLIRAAKIARQMGLQTVGLLGFDGGVLASELDFSIIVKTEIGKYGPVEDAHLAICHAISKDLLDCIITMDLD